MTTTLRPAGPLHETADGSRSRTYDVCVNSRPVGSIELATDPVFGHTAVSVPTLRIDEADRRRGRATVAALAAEEIARGWGCGLMTASVPPAAHAALRLAESLGYTERSRNMVKTLPEHPPELPAGVETRSMTAAEYERWLAGAYDDYARSWIDRGLSPDVARAKSRESFAKLLPDGLATPGTSIEVLVHQGAVVGHVWVARRELSPGTSGAYVYEVVVVEEQRGKGHGRALMLLAERTALAAGHTELGLHVFADNTPAVRLYESLGYATTRHNFFKRLL
ncbi:GNAT family N-acetyltransferase [Streptomyces hebeiensis]|uniref:GNAT family N-acetyltransferase n=1 Tax=Streptomyces hebeiensis TaxID=229486 RepID=A0ABP4FIP5_9ACTN